MARRRFLAQMATWPLAALVPITTFAEPRSASLKAKVARNVRLICAGDVEALERAA
jgi:hypothetical protein